ncbi:hypothetical protein C8J56DRAFT_1052571 [Mycena floridula]|nr:hypothetical protein C8J56DRAFT_1052571 [Mycena floridula]
MSSSWSLPHKPLIHNLVVSTLGQKTRFHRQVLAACPNANVLCLGIDFLSDPILPWDDYLVDPGAAPYNGALVHLEIWGTVEIDGVLLHQVQDARSMDCLHAFTMYSINDMVYDIVRDNAKSLQVLGVNHNSIKLNLGSFEFLGPYKNDPIIWIKGLIRRLSGYYWDLIVHCTRVELHAATSVLAAGTYGHIRRLRQTHAS